MEHQFSLFGFQPPKSKVPLSAERIREVQMLLEAKDGKGAAIKLRELREGLENYERRINQKQDGE
jgi:hypothetical protein